MYDVQINFKSTSDGWRGKLAQNFTFKNAENITKAISLYLTNVAKDKRIVIGYDTRFMSKEFANFIGIVFQSFGIAVTIIEGPSTTPLLTFTTHKYQFPLGINITASHNPPFDDGIKIRMHYGGTPSDDVINKIETYLGKTLKSSNKQYPIKFINSRKEYVRRIRKIIKFPKKSRSNVKILVDTMHGASYGLLRNIFATKNVFVDYLHEDFDPYFGGINPEPKFESTTELQKIIKNGRYNFGIAHDGDGDRIIGVLPNIGYLSPHDISALLVLYLAKYKHFKGNVLGSSTLGRRIKKVCESLGIVYEIMPVGFKNATLQMLSGNLLLAAEENGGVGFGFYIPERDATLAASILIEAESIIGLSTLYKELEKIAGNSGFCRYNYTPNINRKKLFSKIIKLFSEFNFYDIKSISKLDGLKITYKNDDWLSIRYSGTEEILRIYCESETRNKAVKIKDFALKKIQEIERTIK